MVFFKVLQTSEGISTVLGLPQFRACHLLQVGSNARDGLWSNAAAEGWVAFEHQIHKSAIQESHGNCGTTILCIGSNHELQPHSSVIQILKLAKQMTFQEKFLCRSLFPDRDKDMDHFDILQICLHQDGKSFENTLFGIATKFKVVALYLQKYLQTIKGPHSGDTENLWYSEISREVQKLKISRPNPD